MTATILSNRANVATTSFAHEAVSATRRYWNRSAARHKLLSLDDRLLLDIGLTRHDVLNGRF